MNLPSIELHMLLDEKRLKGAILWTKNNKDDLHSTKVNTSRRFFL